MDYFQQLGREVRVVRNDITPDALERLSFDALVLSPGPGVPAAAGNMPTIIKKYAGVLPILGICLGHQALAEHFGAKIIQAQRPMHGKKSLVFHEYDPLFNHIPNSFAVVRYHSLVCSDLPDTLHLTALSQGGEIMGFRHISMPVYGLQFHPEAHLTQHGLDILLNWCEINALSH